METVINNISKMSTPDLVFEVGLAFIGLVGLVVWILFFINQINKAQK